MSQKRLTPSEFERAIGRMRRSMVDENIAIARAVLVEGHKQNEFILKKKEGDPEGTKTRTAMMVSNVVARVWQSHLENGLPPEGWERFEVCLPNDLVPVVKRIEMDAKANYEKKVKGA